MPFILPKSLRIYNKVLNSLIINILKFFVGKLSYYAI